MQISAESVRTLQYTLQIQIARITRLIQDTGDALYDTAAPPQPAVQQQLGQLLFDLHRISHKAGIIKEACPELPLEPEDLTALIVAIHARDRDRIQAALTSIQTVIAALENMQHNHSWPVSGHQPGDSDGR